MLRAALLLVGLTLYPVWATAAPPAPQSIVIIACKVDDLGLAALPDNVIPSRDYRNLAWHFTNGNELECKREEVPLTDAVALVAPELKELHPDFSDFSQCSAVGMQYAPVYEKAHPGWATMAVGCPVQITANGPDGVVIGWKLPDCPRQVGGLSITCKFDGSII